jgi:hypothetical protein
MDTKLPMGFAIRVESTNWSTCRDALESVLAQMKQMQVPECGVTEAAHWKLTVVEKSDALNDPPGPPKDAYFCLITWPNGTEGLLFPRPGNVPVCTTREKGLSDYATALEHLHKLAKMNPVLANGVTIRLVQFERKDAIMEFTFNEPQVEKQVAPAVMDMHACPRCRRQMSHSHRYGYICEYCNGIED